MTARRLPTRRLLLLVVAASTFAGCGTDRFIPAVSGVVLQDDVGADGAHHYRLSAGGTIDVAPGQRRIVYGTILPVRDDLLLAGPEAGSWIARVAPGVGPDPDCFWVGGRGQLKDGVVQATGGLRLKWAATLDTSLLAADGRFESGVCLNASGEVTSIH